MTQFKVGDLVECVAEFSNKYDGDADNDCKPNHVYLVWGVTPEDYGCQSIWLRSDVEPWEKPLWWYTELENGNPRFKLFDELHKED